MTQSLKSASHLDSLISSLERELLNVDQWLSINKMTVNTKKTEVIFFGNKSRLKKLDNKTVKLLVNALVMLYFHYYSPAWSSAAPFRLRKVDKKVVRCFQFFRTERQLLYIFVINKDMSLLIFKALNNVAPNYICSKINMARNSNSHNTRGAAKNHLQLSSANNKFGLKTFACRAPKFWNDLPSQLLEIESLLKFKTSVNDFFQKM